MIRVSNGHEIHSKEKITMSSELAQMTLLFTEAYLRPC